MFLHKNAKRANQVRDEIKNMKEKIAKYGSKLREINSFGNHAQVNLETQILNVQTYMKSIKPIEGID